MLGIHSHAPTDLPDAESKEESEASKKRKKGRRRVPATAGWKVLTARPRGIESWLRSRTGRSATVLPHLFRLTQAENNRWNAMDREAHRGWPWLNGFPGESNEVASPLSHGMWVLRRGVVLFCDGHAPLATGMSLLLMLAHPADEPHLFHLGMGGSMP